jgi:hypothetical protein
MSLRSRILRFALITLAVLLVTGFAAFSTLFFNPLESDLDEDVAALVPRDVDFFVAKAHIEDAFDKFPHLSVEPRLEKLPAWTAWTNSPECAAFVRDMRIEETLKQLEEAAKQIPLGMQPQEVFGGRDLAIAGWFRGGNLEQAEWAAYGRANWAGKLAAAAITHPGLIGLQKQGITAKEDGDVVTLSGGQLPRPICVTRIRDVVIVATQPTLAKKAHELQQKAFQDSLYQSAAYDDHIRRAWRNKEGDEFEVYLNARKMIESFALTAPWPNPKSQDFTPALLGRLFQLASLKDALGVVGVDEGLQLDLHGDFSSEQITQERERVYRTRGFDRNQLLGEAARLAPRDTSLFVYLHAPIGDFLRMMLASCEPSLKANIEDQMRSTGKYPTIDKLVNELDGALKDRLCLIVRPNDYPVDPEGPTHDSVPVPAVAIVAWTKDVGPINELRKLIGEQGSRFGLRGKTANDPGFFKNYEAGYETREYWQPLIPGTGVIVTANAGDLTVVTNSIGMMGHIIKTFTQHSEKYPSLADEPGFQALVQSSLARANLIAWANPKSAAAVLRSRARYTAENSFHLDQATERERLAVKLLRDSYGGRPVSQLTPEETDQLNGKLDEEVAALYKRVKQEQIPALMADQERWISSFEAANGALLMLALDPKSFDLSVRVPVPLPAK